jgi:hypothetical protein
VAILDHGLNSQSLLICLAAPVLTALNGGPSSAIDFRGHACERPVSDGGRSADAFAIETP